MIARWYELTKADMLEDADLRVGMDHLYIEFSRPSWRGNVSNRFTMPH
jgi:hypothetical protein